jgi:hypothetical protein
MKNKTERKHRDPVKKKQPTYTVNSNNPDIVPEMTLPLTYTPRTYHLHSPLLYAHTCPASHKLYGGGGSSSGVAVLAAPPPSAAAVGAAGATDAAGAADDAAIHPAALAIILGKYCWMNDSLLFPVSNQPQPQPREEQKARKEKTHV